MEGLENRTQREEKLGKVNGSSLFSNLLLIVLSTKLK